MVAFSKKSIAVFAVAAASQEVSAFCCWSCGSAPDATGNLLASSQTNSELKIVSEASAAGANAASTAGTKAEGLSSPSLRKTGRRVTSAVARKAAVTEADEWLPVPQGNPKAHGKGKKNKTQCNKKIKAAARKAAAVAAAKVAPATAVEAGGKVLAVEVAAAAKPVAEAATVAAEARMGSAETKTASVVTKVLISPASKVAAVADGGAATEEEKKRVATPVAAAARGFMASTPFVSSANANSGSSAPKQQVMEKNPAMSKWSTRCQEHARLLFADVNVA